MWDDWGGFYDDILPYNCNSSGACSGYPNNSSTTPSSQYVYGFRDPLLVVSGFAKLGYVSGPCFGSACNSLPQQQYIHDFGSILYFIEYAFGQNGNLVGQPTYPNGIGYNSYP